MRSAIEPVLLAIIFKGKTAVIQDYELISK
jgi:hypothetical protein